MIAPRTLKPLYNTDMIDSLKRLVRDIPDFPKPGIVFKDITPVLADRAALALAVECMAHPWRDARIDVVVGPESRGFIFGTALATALNAGFVPVRKPGKLPSKTRSVTYDLEYGTDTLHVHADAMSRGTRVLLADDLLATGGTLAASATLVREMGAECVGASVFIELTGLSGRERLVPMRVSSVLTF
jgi:adenine phosphoribosyltransferase